MSKKVHVFNAGPCLLPQVAIDKAIEALNGRVPRLVERAPAHPGHP